MVATMTEPDLTVEQVAERLQVNPETVRRWLRTKRLRGYRLGGDKTGWRVRAADLERFRDAAANRPEER